MQNYDYLTFEGRGLLIMENRSEFKKGGLILSPIQLNLLELTKWYKCEYEMKDARMEKKEQRREPG